MAPLPHQTYSILEFNQVSKALLEDDREIDFIRFALTGEVDGHQVVIDPYINCITDHHPIRLRRDYDSLLGISRDIKITSKIYIFPLARHEDTLKTNIHLAYPIMNGNKVHTVPVGEIPNIALGKWGLRNMLRVLFPNAWVPGRKWQQQLTQDMQRDFYEQALRPAIETLTVGMVQEWPVTYSDEMFRGRRGNGTFSFQQKILDEHYVPRLPEVLRDQIEESGLEWAKDCLFLHQVRGTKDGETHDPKESDALAGLDHYLDSHSLCRSITEEEDWWIDVGIECIDVDGCLFWKTDSHGRVVQHIANITASHARRITSPGSTAYQRDLVSHLSAISGCRITPGVRAQGPNKIKYIQMYSTDKAVIYNPDGKHYGKAMTGMGAIQFDVEPPFCRSLYALYHNARSKINSQARLEVRTPIKFARRVLLDIQPNVLRQALIGLDSTTLWDFRAYRLLAASKILILQRQGPPSLRVSGEALSLTAGVVWLINGLHSRPEEGKAARNLVASVLPQAGSDDRVDLYTFGPHDRAHENEDSDSDNDPESGDEARPSTQTSIPYGMVFFRPLSLPDVSVVPRLKRGRLIDDETFHHFFKKTLGELRTFLNPVGINTREEQAKYRIPTSKKLTPTYTNWTGEPQPSLFSLERQGYSLPRQPVDYGSDLEGDTIVETPSGSLDAQLSQIWRQFLIDVIIKSPNPQGMSKPSYCRISLGARTDAGEDLYQTRNLAKVWRVCQYKVAADAEWENAFKHLWPPKGNVTGAHVQNYRLCGYFTRYKDLIFAADDALANAIRAQIRIKMNSLYWIPHATSDKMWNTSRNAKGFQSLPSGHAGPAPHLLVRGRAPEWEEEHEPVSS